MIVRQNVTVTGDNYTRTGATSLSGLLRSAKPETEEVFKPRRQPLRQAAAAARLRSSHDRLDVDNRGQRFTHERGESQRYVLLILSVNIDRRRGVVRQPVGD